MKKDQKIIRGPPAVEIPNVSLGQYIIDRLRSGGTRTILVNAENEEVVTNKYILEKSVKLASVFAKKGMKIGDRVSIISENHRDWMIPACATLFVGGAVAPFNPSYTEYELRPLLTVVKPKIIFVSRKCAPLLVKMAPTLNWKVEIIQLDDENNLPSVTTLKKTLDDCREQVNPETYVPFTSSDISKQRAAILCSSGTTGLPKGVCLSHRNMLAFLVTTPLPDYMDIRPGDTFLVYLPFYHGYAFGLLMSFMVNQIKGVFMKTFQQDLVLESIGKYQVTHLPLVPPVLVLLAKHPALSRYDFRSVREVICGAAPLPKDLVHNVKKRLNVDSIRNAYGMTELSIVISFSDRTGREDDACCLMHGCFGKIVDTETGQSLDPGQVGEICIAGDFVMLEYYGNPKATQETIDPDGWLHTGDLGYYDARGKIHVVDRLKELIKYKGYQVSPAELEMILLSHPSVKDGAVVGKPSGDSGEIPTAFVVKQPGANVTGQEIVKFVNEKLSHQKWLRGGVHFVQAIPKNPTGKILRKELREMISRL